MSLGQTEAEVDFDMKKFFVKMSFQWAIAKGARANDLATVNFFQIIRLSQITRKTREMPKTH